MKQTIQKLFITCLALTAFIMLPSKPVQATDSIEMSKDRTCTVESVTLNINGKSETFYGSLKPYTVPADTVWVDFLKNIEFSDFTLLNNGDCTAGSHVVKGYMPIGTNTHTLLRAGKMTYENYSDKYNGLANHTIDTKYYKAINEQNYIDLVFQLAKIPSSNITVINVRFAKSYDIHYDLDGGSLPDGVSKTYVAGTQMTLPTPTKDGYTFAGWTGTGLTKPTVFAVVCPDTITSLSYKATWKKNTTTNINTNTSTNTNSNTKPSVSVGTIFTYKNANYKVTANTKKKVEVTYLGYKKNAKTITVPATVKLTDGRTAKVTAIAPNAFAKNKKVTQVSIGKNINTIGKRAFYKCSKLKTLTIKSKKITKKKIGKQAFSQISKKAVFKVPKGKLKTYKKILRSKGLNKKARITV